MNLRTFIELLNGIDSLMHFDSKAGSTDFKRLRVAVAVGYFEGSQIEGVASARRSAEID